MLKTDLQKLWLWLQSLMKMILCKNGAFSSIINQPIFKQKNFKKQILYMVKISEALMIFIKVIELKSAHLKN
jgi:hypothetical protein